MFNQKIQVAENSEILTPFGFIAPNYAANLVAMTVTNRSNCIKVAKAKILDLEALREKPQVFPISKFELILGLPQENVSIPSDIFEKIHTEADHLMEIAKQQGIDVFPADSVNSASQRIISNAA